MTEPTSHPSEPEGFLSRATTHTAGKAGAGSGNARFSFGPDAGLDLAGLRGGLALIGPASRRLPLINAFLGDASIQGVGYVVVSVAKASSPCDAAADFAARDGRDEAFRVVEVGADPTRTHRLAAFSDLDATALTLALVACSPDLAADTAVAGRGRQLLSLVCSALVHFRDAGQADPDPDPLLIAGHLGIRKLIDLADKDFHPDMPASVREGITAYLNALPGFNEMKRYIQSPQVLDAHWTAQALAADAVGWMVPGRHDPFLATGWADLSASDLGLPGRGTVLRAARTQGDGRPAVFLLSLAIEALRARRDRGPCLLVVDGVDELPPWLAAELAMLPGEGIALVAGMSDVETPECATLAREMRGLALLDGCNPSVQVRLGWGGPPPGAGLALLGTPGASRSTRLPVAGGIPSRGAVRRMERQTSKAKLAEDKDSGRVLGKLTDPAYAATLAAHMATHGEDAVADLARGMADRDMGNDPDAAALEALASGLPGRVG